MLYSIKDKFHPSGSNDLVDQLVAFEQQLAAISPDEEYREDVTKTYNPKTMQEAADMIPQVDISFLIAERNPNFKPDMVIVSSPEYLKALARLLKDTPKETLATYFAWKIVQEFVGAVEDDGVAPLKRFNNGLNGKAPDAKPERWRTCLRQSDRAVGEYLVSRLLPPLTI